MSLAGCAAAQSRVSDSVQLIAAPVEHALDPQELHDVVARYVAAAPICFPIPAAYWEGATPFTARFGPTQFQGRAIAPDAEQQFDVFVALGLWTKTPARELGERVFTYTLTETGAAAYRGHPYQPRGQAEFCPPAERRLLRIVGTGPGFQGGLLVRFVYAGNDASSWLSPSARDRLPRPLPTVAPDAQGFITLFRVWRRDRDPLENAPRSGHLETFCVDYVHNRLEACGAELR
jgi:hypothetical protein